MNQDFDSRVRILKYFFLLVFVLYAGRLFELQIIRNDEFTETARMQHEKRSILTARRGKILVQKNRYTEDLTPLATNHTLKMLFIDPVVLAFPNYGIKDEIKAAERGNPQLAAQLLAPLLINAHCEELESCPFELDKDKLSQSERNVLAAYEQTLAQEFSAIERRRVVIATETDLLREKTITDLNLPGITVKNGNVLADPTRISSPESIAKTLGPLIGMDADDLKPLLRPRKKRYAEISRKISRAISEKIIALKRDPKYKKILHGIQLRDEHWRYYPEKNLASQTLGFLDRNGEGQYGIEGRFNQVLSGKAGLISGATTTSGKQILSEGFGITRAQDGSDIVLSIDRVIQNTVEKIIAEDVKTYDADSGQVIIIEPHTGRILAMAHAPTFDPNDYGEVYSRFEVTAEQEELDREDLTFNQRIPTTEDNNKFYRYFNLWGPEVFRNKIVTDQYEPGSVIKPITMAAAINADEVTPQSTFDDYGPVEIDEFKIKNSDSVYAGQTTMVEIINRSLNTGIAFLTRKMGAEMVYENLKNFGFSQYTDIELDGEARGKLEFWKDWEESELVTRGYGQGFTASPLQVAMSYAALANGGYLMKPLLVEQIISPEGDTQSFEPERVHRIVSEQTFQTTKAMLLSAVDNGVARGASVHGHSVMGKTGTSQTYKDGKALTGKGTTITSFAGFAPYDTPEFVILVKFDRPRVSQWGSETAAPTFRRIATFLFDYYQIPPEN